MKTLHITLKKKWFDMILSGEKKEEYRELKPYWIKRLISEDFSWDCKTIEDLIYHYNNVPNAAFFKPYKYLSAKNGYSKNAPEFITEHLDIQIKEGKSEWGAEPGKKYFTISVGEILSTKNIP